MKIAKLALITSLIGVFLLIILSQYLEPKIRPISEISKSEIGNFVKVSGKVSNIKQTKITTFDLSDKTGEIDIVSFDKINISNNQDLEIIGKVNTYYNSLQIEAREIKSS